METIERYNDRTRLKKLPHFELTGSILNCCFEVMERSFTGFSEIVIRTHFVIAMRQKGLQVEVERSFEVVFRGNVIGRYRADLMEKTCKAIRNVLLIWKRLKSQYRFEHPKKNLIVISLYRFHR